MAALHYLTNALYKSLCHHCKLDDPEQSKKLTLPFGLPRTNGESDRLLPFPPNDPQRGHTFADRVKALLRRHIVERCIYGVDINPLAVELARVSLWVETLDPELPFSFLDHKIKVGNSLVGCWLDRVEDYPLKAWEREGGDGKDGARTQRIETFLKGEKIGKRRTGDGQIKREMREVIESRFQNIPSLFPSAETTTGRVVAEARAEYETLHELPITKPDERERHYREHIEDSPALRTLRVAMDEWCAVWFWPTDEESLKNAPTPLTCHKESPAKDVIVERLANEFLFFHWELEFPDVFTSDQRGFSAIIGNPPWEVMKPISQEFFTEYDPLYRTYDKQTALRHQQQMFAEIVGVKDQWEEYSASFKAWSNWVKSTGDPFDIALDRGRRQAELAAAWAKVRADRTGFAASQKPFSFQGSADLNSYKLFLEIAHHLLASGGRMGLIVPSGLYTDAGCHDLRDLFLSRSTWDWLFGFINWEQIFSIYYRFKFVITIAERRGSPTNHAIRSCFGRFKLRDWEEANSVIFPLPKKNVVEFSPKTLSILEITNQRDLDICRKIYERSFRIGDNAPGWEIAYAAEFHMTNDSKLFKPREWWEAKNYKPDVFGRWIGPEGDVALPLYEGRMIGQFDFSQKGYVSGRGRSAVWRELPPHSKAIEPQFLMAQTTFVDSGKGTTGWKLVGMSIASSTNSRTVIAACQSGFPCNHALFTLRFPASDVEKCLLLEAIVNSLPFDYATRQRVGGLNLSWFIIEECPLPTALTKNTTLPSRRLLHHAAALTLVHRRFAPDWLRLRNAMPELSKRQWKHCWAATEEDRLRLRLETDALCSDAYGLAPDDLDWILRDDPNDPKGFHRVDKHLPYRERFTGLAASTFRALKEGKWSAEAAATLTNDEFFEIIGIPEMTVGPDPLIRKRNGCHRWKPEEFGKDDPRYGWTWEHCWQDAVAICGSEDAVQKYIEGEPSETGEPADAFDGPTDLFGNPMPIELKQKKLL